MFQTWQVQTNKAKTSIRYANENDREKRERKVYVRDIYRERECVRERHKALPYRVCALVENLREIFQSEK